MQNAKFLIARFASTEQLKQQSDAINSLPEILVNNEKSEQVNLFEQYQKTMSDFNIKERDQVAKYIKAVIYYEETPEIQKDNAQWIQDASEWIRYNFNPPENEVQYTDQNGERKTAQIENVKVIARIPVADKGESLHAFIIPLDRNGKLNVNEYVNPETIKRMRAGFNELAEKYGLNPHPEKVKFNQHGSVEDLKLKPKNVDELINEATKRAEKDKEQERDSRITNLASHIEEFEAKDSAIRKELNSRNKRNDSPGGDGPG